MSTSPLVSALPTHPRPAGGCLQLLLHREVGFLVEGVQCWAWPILHLHWGLIAPMPMALGVLYVAGPLPLVLSLCPAPSPGSSARGGSGLPCGPQGSLWPTWVSVPSSLSTCCPSDPEWDRECAQTGRGEDTWRAVRGRVRAQTWQCLHAPNSPGNVCKEEAGHKPPMPSPL